MYLLNCNTVKCVESVDLQISNLKKYGIKNKKLVLASLLNNLSLSILHSYH